MKSLILRAAAVTAGAAPRYHYDVARYLYATPGVEQAHRTELLAAVEGFSKQPESSLDTAAAFARWLASYDSLLKRLNKHDLYVYMRAEEDADDHADAEADEILETAMARMESTAERVLGQLGVQRLHTYIGGDASLSRYRYFIDSMLARAAHVPPCATADALLIRPALDSLTESYKS